MYNNYGVQRYKEADINSISKEKMIVLLYEKMQSDLMGAAKALKQENRVEMTRLINHSQRIVSELRGALDHNIGGEVSRNLESLYDYMFHQHLELLVDQDETHIENCLRVIAPLLEAWRQVPAGAAEQTIRKGLGPETGPENATETVPRNESNPEAPVGRDSLLSISA